MEPGMVNQIHSFPPLCPITARYNVIPAGYNGRLPADSSHQIYVDQAVARMRSLLRRRGLRKGKSFDETAGNSLGLGEIRPCSGANPTQEARRPKAETPCRAIEGFNKMRMAISFLGGWIEAPDAGLNSNFRDRITLTFRTYNPQE